MKTWTAALAAAVLALLLLASPLAHARQPLTRQFTLRSASPSTAAASDLASKLKATCWDFHLDDNGDIMVTGFEEDKRTFEGMGFEIVSETFGRPLSLDPPAGYRTPEELFSLFQGIVADYPAIASLVDLTATYKAPLTHEGRSLYALKISDNVAEDENEPNFLVVSNHHARELITPELALNASLELVTKYNVDPEVTKIVNSNQIYIMWTMNPDGLAYVWSNDNLWRKNRRPNSELSYGVDQNRNYPIGWDFSCGGSTIPSSETYKGPAAASEPETQTMMLFQKERRFAKVLDFHSYAREVRIIYADCASLPQTLDDYFRDVGVDFADTIRYAQTRSCCMAGNVHFAFHDQASLVFLVETGTAFQPPIGQVRDELVRVWPGTKYFLGLPIPLSGTVTDRQSGKPLEARITVQGLNFELNEVNQSNPANGLYHLWVPARTWNVTFSAAGYNPRSFEVPITAAGTTLNVAL